MRIVFLGSGEFGRESLKKLSERNHEILEVVTQPARRSGRGRKVTPTPIARLAEQLKLPISETDNVNEPNCVEHIRSLGPELLLVIAFGQKIGPALLKQRDFRTVNLHGSLLPKYRGAAPINWAIINGDRETGITLIEMDEGWDTGDILGQHKTAIKPGETAGELHDRLAQMGPGLLSEVLDRIVQGTDEPIKQDESRASRAPKLKKSDGAIHWTQSAEKISCQIHGMWPWPGSFCRLQQKGREKTERVNVARVEFLPESPPTATVGVREPGMIIDDMSVLCGEGKLRLLEVKPENGKLMPFGDFVNGRHIQSGDCFLDG